MPRWFLVGAVIGGVALGGPGCAGFAPVVDEPLRVGTVEDLSPEALGLEPGVTTLDDARAHLRRRGLTGVVDDSFATSSGTVAVLAADYQSRVFLFRDARFIEALALPTQGLPPYDLAVRLAAEKQSPALIVLYRDPLDRADQPPTMLVFHLREARTGSAERGVAFDLAAEAKLGALAARQRGLSQPLFVGNDLADGVMFVARDRAGALWDTSYLVRVEGDRIALEPRAMSDALRCSCVQRYADGEPKR